jgi:hypothetical protein
LPQFSENLAEIFYFDSVSIDIRYQRVSTNKKGEFIYVMTSDQGGGCRESGQLYDLKKYIAVNE